MAEKAGDLSFYKTLTGEEAVVLFSLLRDYNQEQLAIYFDVHQSTISRLYKSAIDKVKDRGLDRH